MPQTHDLGRVYLQVVKPLRRWTKPLERTWSAEIEYPFRLGQCVLFHVPGMTSGFVLGLWGPPGDEEEILRKAAGVRNLGPQILENETDYDEALAT